MFLCPPVWPPWADLQHNHPRWLPPPNFTTHILSPVTFMILQSDPQLRQRVVTDDVAQLQQRRHLKTEKNKQKS